MIQRVGLHRIGAQFQMCENRARAIDLGVGDGVGIGRARFCQRQNGQRHRLQNIAADHQRALFARWHRHHDVAMGRRIAAHIRAAVGKAAVIGAAARIAQKIARRYRLIARIISDIGRIGRITITRVNRLIDIDAVRDGAMKLCHVAQPRFAHHPGHKGGGPRLHPVHRIATRPVPRRVLFGDNLRTLWRSGPVTGNGGIDIAVIFKNAKVEHAMGNARRGAQRIHRIGHQAIGQHTRLRLCRVDNLKPEYAPFLHCNIDYAAARPMR